MRRADKLRAAAGVVTLACATGLWAATEVGGGAAQEAVNAGVRLSPALPVRREVAVGSEPRAWSATFGLLSVAGAVGGLWVWRRRLLRGTGLRIARRQEADVVRISSQALTQQASVHAVQWQGQEFLLGCTAQQVTLLSRRPVGAGPGAER